eukprot:CAMPEP_0179845874 /NCGR_PEP_ID=MMETSP0982-20121206/5254_1 /TAXON_ID=483367 /ORGANISM="non described non described, Strain CCMP 2436" /LENGTH=132 /DNA_ID=CAMNT_0021730965 /DNA_START=316 /DNA_END=714 /DNA_ORIENTATION=-
MRASGQRARAQAAYVAVASLGERLAAQLARVRLFARVHPHVRREFDASDEALVAHFAHVRLLARVRPRVHREVARLGEHLAAHLARVRLLARVQQRRRLRLWLCGLDFALGSGGLLLPPWRCVHPALLLRAA